LLLAEADASIQGYSDGVFWERNTLHQQIRAAEIDCMPGNSVVSRLYEGANQHQTSLFEELEPANE
jgi:hypothetical protein